MVPAYTLPPNAQEEHDHARIGEGDDEPRARRHPCSRHQGSVADTLAKKGGAHEAERAKMITGPGH